MARETLERGVRWDSFWGKYTVASYKFAWLEMANIFAYLAVQYGATFAETVIHKIEKKFTAAGVAWDILSNAGTSVKDVILSVGPRIAGDAYMKFQISQSPWADYNLYDAQRDTSEYVEYLMLSWCAAPKYKPRYHLMAPGALGGPNH